MNQFTLPDGRYDRSAIMSAICAAASADRARSGCSWRHAFRYNSHQIWFLARAERARCVEKFLYATEAEVDELADARSDMWAGDAACRAAAALTIDTITARQRARARSTMKRFWP